MTRILHISEHAHPILGAIRSVPVSPRKHEPPSPPPPVPFITLSRQPGAGASTLPKQFVEAINKTLPEDQHWTCWDRELLQKVAADMHLPAHLVESIEDHQRSWFSDVLESLSFSDDSRAACEAKIYNHVSQTIRALAQAGRAVIADCGGIFITRRMRGGIHVRLVAPFEHRVAFMAMEYHLTPDKAAARIKELEHNRLAFYRLYWANESIGTETFALTINTAEVGTEATIEMLKALVHRVAVPANP
jgi:cytidylate kinase